MRAPQYLNEPGPGTRPLRCVGGSADGQVVHALPGLAEVTVAGDRYSARYLWAAEQPPATPVQGRHQGLVEWLAPTNVSDRVALLHIMVNWRQP